MFNLDFMLLEKELLEKKFSKNKTIIFEFYWTQSGTVPKGNLIQDGTGSIQLDISWYVMEKINLETMKMIMSSASDLQISICDFLEEKGYKFYST